MSDIFPPGRYHARAIEWYFDQTGKGTPYLQVTFRIEGPENSVAVGRLINGRFYLSEAAAQMTLKSLRVMGWTTQSLGDLHESQGGLDANVVMIKIENREYDGRTTSEVRGVDPVGADMHSRVHQLDQQLREKLAEVDARIAGEGGVPSTPELPGARKPDPGLTGSGNL